MKTWLEWLAVMVEIELLVDVYYFLHLPSASDVRVRRRQIASTPRAGTIAQTPLAGFGRCTTFGVTHHLLPSLEASWHLLLAHFEYARVPCVRPCGPARPVDQRVAKSEHSRAPRPFAPARRLVLNSRVLEQRRGRARPRSSPLMRASCFVSAVRSEAAD